MIEPNIYKALKRDNVDNWIKHDQGAVEASDFVSNDFPNLRRALEANQASYRFQVTDTLDGKMIRSLHSAMGFVVQGGDGGITEEQIGILVEAKA
jgi:hypothetical protein